MLPGIDWVALAAFFTTGVGSAQFARHHARSSPSLLGSTNRERECWMWPAAGRDNRIFAGTGVQNLSASPSLFAFFGFTWGLRQCSFGALLVASVPSHAEPLQDEVQRQAFVQRAGHVVGLAAESFNGGLRAYYMAFAAVGRFFSPWAMKAGTLGVEWVPYRREFHSEVLQVLDGR